MIFGEFGDAQASASFTLPGFNPPSSGNGVSDGKQFGIDVFNPAELVGFVRYMLANTNTDVFNTPDVLGGFLGLVTSPSQTRPTQGDLRDPNSVARQAIRTWMGNNTNKVNQNTNQFGTPLAQFAHWMFLESPTLDLGDGSNPVIHPEIKWMSWNELVDILNQDWGASGVRKLGAQTKTQSVLSHLTPPKVMIRSAPIAPVSSGIPVWVYAGAGILIVGGVAYFTLIKKPRATPNSRKFHSSFART